MLLILITLLVLFSISSVQTFIAQKITNSINESRDVDVSIGRVWINYSGEVVLGEVLIKDHHQDTLIFSEEVETSVSSLQSLFDNNLILGNTTAKQLELHMRVYEGEDRDNLNIFLRKLKSQTRKKTGKEFVMTAGELDVIDSRFSYIDENLSDPELLILDELDIEAKNFLLEGSDLFVDVQRLSGFEKRGVRINSLSTAFSYTSESMELQDLEIYTRGSSVSGDVTFDISDGFSGFADRVPVVAEFNPSVLSTSDLNAFYDKFGSGGKISFSANLKGTLNDFMLTELEVKALEETRLIGALNLKNTLGKPEEEFSLQGEIFELTTDYNDLVNLLPDLLREKLPDELKVLELVQAEGEVFVSENRLVADANLASELGKAQVDLSIDHVDDVEKAVYEGHFIGKDFNLGRVTGVKSLGRTSFDLVFDGQGLSAETLNSQVRGSISELMYNGYIYNNLKVRGVLKAPVFNGNFVSLDPNLKMEFNGLADFSEDINRYDFEASVGYADLAALNIVERDSLAVFKGDIIINAAGTDIDDAAGKLLLLNTSYENENETYFFKDLKLTSTFDGPVRRIEVISPDVVNGSVEGIFDIEEVPDLFENALGSLYTNYRPNDIKPDQYIDFDFDIYNKIVEVFFPEITLAPNTYLRGSLESDESEFRLSFKSPEIKAFDNLFEDVNIQVDNSNPLFNTFVEIDSIGTEFYDVSDFNLINVTLNDTLFVRSEFRGGPRNDDIYNLNLYHTINEDNKSVIGIQKSDIKFKESIWHINEEENDLNRIVLDKGFDNIRIDSLVLSHKEEEIRLAGELRDSTYKNIRLKFEDVDLYKITPEIPNFSMEGLVNGSVSLLQREDAYFPTTSLTVADLEINDQLLGNLNVDVMGNKDLSLYNINTTLRNKGLESFSAIGEIIIEDNVPLINLDVDLRKLDMSAFSPLGRDVITNIRGFASGSADVTGDYKNPDITGKLVLEDAGLSIPYLEVDYVFEEGAVVDLSDQQFYFDEVQFRDTKYETTGILEGTITHQNFRDWVLGLNVTTDRLLVLDTEFNEDALYYGTGFIGGNAAIYGPTSELVIDVVGTTRRGTVFKIPLNDSETIGDNSFIHFLSPAEKAALLAGEKIEVEEVKGLELNFDLDVTSEALVEIEVDGSVLRGKGAGTLLIEINTLGRFNMWGDFIVNTGEYIFNYGALQKRFTVRPGGSINWSGNPALADLNMSAVYEAHANPAIILENPGISRRIPVAVVINLDGELVQPDISFDLEYPNVNSAVRSELEYKIGTNTNVEMQAFSLLALGQFYTPDVLGGNAGSALLGGVFQSASSGIFSNLLADSDETFQVGLNYEQGSRTPEQTTADRFGVTLSTQISDRVLINGQVGVPVGGVTETVIVGNLEIEFLLNEEGNLRAKIFNRENDIQYLGEELGFTQGVGLSYQVDFNTFKQLLRKIVQNEVESAATKVEEPEVETENPELDK